LAEAKATAPRPLSPLTAVWCLANENVQPVMQVVFTADFTHDGHKEALVIVNAYPKKSKAWYPF
jgi:hypothetical protein